MLPRGMPKRKGKDVLDMTKQCTRSFIVRQEEDEEAAAEPEDEDDEDDGGESEGRTMTNRGRTTYLNSIVYLLGHSNRIKLS